MYGGDDDFTFTPAKSPSRGDDDFTFKPAAPVVPSGTATGARRPLFAQLVSQGGSDMGHGFKEADTDLQGFGRTRIREDGAIWNGKTWVDPDTGKDAGPAPTGAVSDAWGEQNKGLDFQTSPQAAAAAEDPNAAYLRSKGIDIGRGPGAGLVAKLPQWAREAGTRQMAKSVRAQDNPLGALATELGNAPLAGAVQPGNLVEMVRGAVTDEPLAVESALASPNVGSFVKGTGKNFVLGPGQAAAWLKDKALGTKDLPRMLEAGRLWEQSFEDINPSVVGEAIPMMMAGGVGGAGGGTSVLRSALGTAVPSAILGAMSPDVESTTPEQYQSGMATRAALGGALGFAGGGLGAKLAKASAPTPAAFTERAALGEAAGQNMTAGQITNSPTLKKLENLSAYLWGGMGKYREAENPKNREYAIQFAETLKRAMNEAGYENIPQLEAAANSGGTNADYAGRILSAIRMAGQNRGAVVEASREAKLFGVKSEADVLQNALEDVSRPLPESPGKNTLSAIRNLTTELRKGKWGIGKEDSTKAFAELDDALGRMESQPITDSAVLSGANASGSKDVYGTAAPKSAVDIYGTPVNPVAEAQETVVGPRMTVETRDYMGLKGLRTRIGELQSGAAASKKKALAKFYGILRRAVERDMAEQASPETAGLQGEYDDFIKNVLVPSRDSKYAQKFASSEPGTIIRNFTQAQDEGAGEWLYSNLDAKGQAAVRADIAVRAVRAGLSGATAGRPTVDTGKIASQIDELSPAMQGESGVIPTWFKGKERQEIEAFGKLMRALEANAPESDAGAGALMKLAKFAGKTTGVGASAASLGTLGPISRWLFTSPSGKKILMAAIQQPEDSQAFRLTVAMLRRQAAILAAQEAEQATNRNSR